MDGGTVIFISAMVGIIGYLIGRAVKQEVYGYNGATEWREYMWCKECDIGYAQYGLNQSVYNCRKCGNRTSYAMGRYNEGEFELKDRR